MDSRIITTNSTYDESSSLFGQELVNFVIKTSESLHNVINRAKNSSLSETIGKRKTTFKRKNIIRTKSLKTKSNAKMLSNDKKTFTNDNNNNSNSNHLNMSMDSSKKSINNKFEEDLELTSSSCEELFDIPMEELLSSPTWKHIVQQNSFVWP